MAPKAHSSLMMIIAILFAVCGSSVALLERCNVTMRLSKTIFGTTHGVHNYSVIGMHYFIYLHLLEYGFLLLPLKNFLTVYQVIRFCRSRTSHNFVSRLISNPGISSFLFNWFSSKFKQSYHGMFQCKGSPGQMHIVSMFSFHCNFARAWPEAFLLFSSIFQS